MRGLIALCAALTAIGPVVGPAPYEAPSNRAQQPPVLTAGHPVLPADGRNTEARRKLLPKDPLKRAAARAINGDFGVLEEWQRVGWQRVLDHGTDRPQTAWITNYWTGEPGVGTVCASGRSVETGRTAAMLHHTGRRLRSGEFGDFYVLELPGGYELRQVWDTGSPANLGRAERRGAVTWLDRYVPGRDGRTWIAPIHRVRSD